MTMEEEERNFCSLVLLLLRVGAPCLRVFFKTQWDSTGRTPWTDTTQNGTDLLQIFKPLPYEKNNVKSGDRSTWGLSLIIKVLLQSFVSTPELVLALERLRELRKKLCDATTLRINGSDFEGFWTDACNALTLFGTKSKEFDKVKKDVQKSRRFLLPELKGCANQDRDILSLIQSINIKQENLLQEQQNTHEQTQHEILNDQLTPRQAQITTLEVMSQDQRNQAEEGQTYNKCVYYYITAKNSSHVAVGDGAHVTNCDPQTDEHPDCQTVDPTRQQTTKDFTDRLKSSIKRQTDDFLHRTDRKIRTDDIFTNITIQCGPECFAQTEREERNGRKREYKVKSRITLLEKCSEIFICPRRHDPKFKAKGSNPKFILLIGKAGIGKSLFCRKIVRDWADDKLFEEEEDAKSAPDFRFAFLLTFRQLNSLGDKALTLKEVLKHSPILDDHSIIGNDVFEIISKDPEKVLIMLDGYDEYAHRGSIVGHFEANYQNDPNEEMPVPALIAKLLKGKIWKKSVVLVTSRPGEASSLEKNVNFDAKAEIKGFSTSQVLDYVKKYFMHNKGMKNAVLGHIRGNENLVRFGHIPVMCYLMCYYMEWQVGKSNLTRLLPTTRTDLYHKVIKEFIKEHHAHLKFKQEKTEEELQEIISTLAEVAVKLTEEKKFSFSKDDMQKLGISQEQIAALEASGLLDCWPSFVNKSQHPFQVPLEYTFTHLTIQEYLSAFGYVEKKMIPEKDKTTNMTLVFIAEMLSTKKDDKKLLKKLLKAIEPADENDDTNRLLTLNCLQGFGDKELAAQRIAELYEKFCNGNGWIVFSDVTDMDCSSVAYLLGIIKSLNDESNYKPTKKFKKHFLVNTLYILNSTLATSGVRSICDSLVNSTVTELDLNCCELDDSHCVEIIKDLSQSKVTILNLPYNHITGEDKTGICRALENCSVKSINLCGNRLTKECKRLILSDRFRKHRPDLKLVLD